jgi:hypothetical protein
MSSRRDPPRPKALLLLLTGVVVLLTVVLILLTEPSASALAWVLAAVVAAAIGTVGLNLGAMAIRHQVDRRRDVEGPQKVHRLLPEPGSPQDLLERLDQLERTVHSVTDRLEQLEQQPTRNPPERAGLERRLPEGQPELAQFVESLSQLEELLREERPSISDSIAGLDLPTLIILARTFERYRGLMEEAIFRSYFEGLFVARIERDTEILAQSLVWIFHLEALLRHFLVEVARNAFGDEWYRAVVAAADEMGVSGGMRPETHSFRDTVAIIAYLFQNDRVHSADVDQRLGEGWQQRMRGLVEPFDDGVQILNNMAHGTIHDSAERYWEHWSEVAQRVFGAATVYIRLRSQQLRDEV